MNAPSIFSRILVIIGALGVVGLTYWFIATSLAPVPVPPGQPARGSVRFDPQADVTKHPKFPVLQQLGPSIMPPTGLGRQNPFLPPPAPVVATSTTGTAQILFVPTSTGQSIELVPSTTDGVEPTL